MGDTGKSSFTRVGRLGVVATALVLIAAACGDDDAAPTTMATTSTTQPPGGDGCEDADHDEQYLVDLDGDGLDELVYLRSEDATGVTIGLCTGTVLVSEVEVEGTDVAIVGFVDLDDDAGSEILFSRAGGRGVELGAVAATLRGLQPTSLSIERWKDLPDGAAPGPFTGDSFQCADWDDDGSLDLLRVAFRPAIAEDIALENVRMILVTLDGLTVVETGVDQYETSFEEALEVWTRRHGCSPGSGPEPSVRFAPNGWGRVEFDPAAFASEGSVVLTGVARGGVENRYVVVGSEQPTFLVSDFFPDRPVVWSSADALTWEKADLGDAEGELRSVAVLAGGGGFVAVGRTGSFAAAAWLSADGRSWEPIEIPPARPGVGFEGPVMSQVAATPVGLVAVGTEDYAPDPGGLGFDIDAAVWLSTDGRSWERIEDPALGSVGYQPNEGDEFNGELVGVAYQPGVGIVAVGSASEPDPTIDYPTQWPAAWVSPDGRQWRRHDIGGDLRLRGVTASDRGLVAYGLTDVMGSPTSDAVVLVSSDGEQWTAAAGAFAGLGDIDGIQTINHAVAVPGVGVVAIGSDEKEFESVGGAAAWWWRATAAEPTWERETHDDRVFETLTDSPTATMTDAIWSADLLVVVGFSGRTVEFPGGGSGCCLAVPAIWMWRAE